MCFTFHMKELRFEEFSLMKNKFTPEAFIPADTRHLFTNTKGYISYIFCGQPPQSWETMINTWLKYNKNVGFMLNQKILFKTSFTFNMSPTSCIIIWEIWVFVFWKIIAGKNNEKILSKRTTSVPPMYSWNLCIKRWHDNTIVRKHKICMSLEMDMN